MGQFDETVDPEDGVSVTPNPGLDPSADAPMASAPMLPAAMLTSALPPGPASVPLPTPPQPAAPPAAPGSLAHIIQSALLGLSAGLGPRSGVGTGIVGGMQLNNVIKEREQIHQQQQYHQHLQESIQLQQLQEAQQKADDARAQKLQQALLTIRTEVKAIPDKATYDQRIEGYANLLRASGYRLDANWLRTAVPYFAPNAKQIATDAVTALFKNPLLQAQIKENPQAVASGFIMADLNGDGIKEKHSVQEMMDAAGMSFLTDESGKPVGMAAGTEGPMANIALKNALAQFRAENKREPTAKEMGTLIEKARETPKDPAMEALAKQSAELTNALKQMQLGQQPTREDAIPIAQDLIKHNMAPSQLQLFGGFGSSGQSFKRMVLLEAKKLDPNFNFEEAESTYQLVKSPGFQNTIRYMDSVVESMPRVQASANQLANGNVRSLNALRVAGQNQFNNVDVKKFQTDVLFVSDEIAKILQGGGSGSGTSDAKLRQAQEILSTSDSPRAIAAALAEAAAMMGNRRSALTRGTYLEKTGALRDPSASARDELGRR